MSGHILGLACIPDPGQLRQQVKSKDRCHALIGRQTGTGVMTYLEKAPALQRRGNHNITQTELEQTASIIL